MKKEIYEISVKIARIGNVAVRKAEEENRSLGVPNVYSINGKLCFELPDGRITMENPFNRESLAT